VASSGTWANPGGTIDGDEQPLVTAMRELEEELGIPATVLRGFIAKTIETNIKREYTLFVLELTMPLALPVLDREKHWETEEVAWIHDFDMSDLRLHPTFREQWNALVRSEQPA
jgi:8-oxo-dGTP pyrophosphatase MutT (NUDIX family)